jgi:preprotein translocase subunit SecF
VSIASRLYHGQISFDYVGRWRTWFLVSALAMLISVIALIYPGLRFGIDFKGGGVFTVQPTHNVTQAQVSSAIGSLAKVVQTSNVESGRPAQIQVQTESLTSDQIAKVRADLARVAGVQPSQVSNSVVGSKWGSTVTRKALVALAVFLAVIVVYVSIRFDFKMSVSALVALIHDLLITAGVYALARFEVSPATVIGLLTILGYSLYDTVVVFDKVRENTGELSAMSRVTYSEAANRAVNQTLVRSLNTSLTSLLPIGALLLAGAILPGAETIKDLSLALFVGVAAGTYSSIFIATPFLALWKETEPRYRQLNARVTRLVASGATAGDGGSQARVRQGARQGGQPGSVAAERRRAPKPPEEAASAAPAGRRPRKGDGDRVAPDEAPMLEPDAPNGLHLEPDEEEPEPVEEPARAAAAPRQPQKPRPSQQRRKSSGRQRSGSSKRRRR